MRNWIIAICSSEGNGILLKRFTGTESDVRKALATLVQEDRNADPDGFDSGTESAEEVELGTENQFDAYANFSDYHIDYTASELSKISVLEV